MCRNINDKAVREAVGSGALSPESVQMFRGCTFNCGKCRPAIAEIIHEELGLGCADECPVCAFPIDAKTPATSPARQGIAAA